MSFLTPLLLSVVPSPLTHQLIPHLSTYLPQIFPPSPPGSPGYQRNFRHVFTLVIGAYLVWSFGWGAAGSGEAESGEAGDWYALLGVGRGAGEDELKRAFRTLLVPPLPIGSRLTDRSRTYHPDRIRQGAEGSGDHFIRIRQAYEGLSDPIKRWAYDRFGADILQWKAVTTREYMRFGINQSSGFYVISGAIMLLLSLLGRAKDGAFWRNLVFVLLLATELHLLLAPSSSASTSPTLLSRSLSLTLGDRPPFLQIRLLHRIFASLSVGINQLAGVWSADRQGTQPGLEEVLVAVRGLEVEAITGFHDIVGPLLSQGDPTHTQTRIKQGMEEVLIDRAISTHPQIRPLWIDALRRAEADRKSTNNFAAAPPSLEAAPYPYPSPPPSPSRSAGRRPQMDSARERRVLGVASGIPLPPSPPPSPLLKPMRL